MKPATRSRVESDEEPAVPFGTFRPSERRALIGCAFASGCLLMMPQELIGAMISFALAGVLGLWHWRRSKREAAQIQGPSPAPATTAAAVPLAAEPKVEPAGQEDREPVS